jgi:hypothetical protein
MSTANETLAAPPEEINLDLSDLPDTAAAQKPNDDGKAPYSARELKTLGQLLGMKVKALLVEFECETGARIDSCRLDYTGRVDVHVRTDKDWIYC